MKRFVDTPPENIAVLFDLDGTLVDTVPDMVAVLSNMQKSRGAEPVAFNTARAYVSSGAIGLLRLAFPDSLTEPLMQARNPMTRAASVVSGDTLPQRKPDPAPLLFAAKQIGLDPSRVVADTGEPATSLSKAGNLADR